MQKFNYQKSNKAAGKIYIGLDHGYGNIKTAHRVFQTGIECYDEEPIVSTNYVKYRDKYYVIGESHLVYQGNKTETDDFYILTLAGLAEEMKYRGLHEADVVLAVGLPLAWVKTQAAEWRNYLMREKELDFSFRKERYKVHLCGLEIFPQGLAAVHNQGSMPGMRKEYRSSNVRFCMDDENQRRTWEYLQSITRKEGSYGKILSDAFVQILDGNYAIEQEALQRNDTDGVIEQILSTQLSMLKRELLEKMESMYDNTQHAASQTGTNRADIENEAADVPETDMSDAMMTMALAMGDWVPE